MTTTNKDATAPQEPAENNFDRSEQLDRYDPLLFDLIPLNEWDAKKTVKRKVVELGKAPIYNSLDPQALQ